LSLPLVKCGEVPEFQRSFRLLKKHTLIVAQAEQPVASQTPEKMAFDRDALARRHRIGA
jgi:hypothetical protein